MTGPFGLGHDFAFERAQRRGMRPALTSLTLAAALIWAGAALAQSATDAPVSTADGPGSGAPSADAATAPAEVAPTPAPVQVQPLRPADELQAAAEAGRRAPLLGEFHGQVGAVVGTGGLRGAYGHVVAHPTDKMVLDLRFSTLHAHDYPYGGAYGALPYDAQSYGPGWRYRRGLDGWSTEVLGPGPDEPAPEAPAGG